MSPAAHPELVLNADFRPLSYFPLSLWPWQDAVHAVIAERVSVVAEYDAVARSPSIEIRLPSVVALREYLRTLRHVAFTRFNVFLRDRFRCQYCGEKFGAPELTFDHVIPRSRGGVTCWENIVPSCSPCNTRKDKFLDMKPLKWAVEPSPQDLLAAKRSFPPNFLHESWLDYLYWDVEIEQ
jgi:5-methylcytosine-specific restriction endonuclease McrA